MTPTKTPQKRSKLQTGIENIIFSSKWMLIPFYFGLFIVMFIYMKQYVFDIIEMLGNKNLNRDNVLMYALEMVDIVMIANLIKMIITGSYNSFVDKTHGKDGNNVSSGQLKVKMATSIAAVTGIHLLQEFIEIGIKPANWFQVGQQLAIHGIFLIGALVLAVIEYLHIKGEILEHQIEK